VVEEAEYPERTTDHGQAIARLAAASDKAYQLLAHGRWFSPGTRLLPPLKLVVKSWARTHAILAFQIGFPKKDCMLTYYHMEIHSHMFEVVRKVEICFCSLR
jgi:hypothetical protein